MNNYWSILNIAPTNDEKTIKKSYAKQLKTIDQEQQSEQFIQLREAYIWAMQYGQFYVDEQTDRTDDSFDQSAQKSGLSKYTITLAEQPKDDSNLINTTLQPIDKTKQDLFENIDALEDLISSGGSLEFASTGFNKIIEDLKASDLNTQMQLNDRIEDILAAHHSAELQLLLLIWQKHIGIDELYWSDRNARKILHERLQPQPLPPHSSQNEPRETIFTPWLFFVCIMMLIHFFRHCDAQSSREQQRYNEHMQEVYENVQQQPDIATLPAGCVFFQEDKTCDQTKLEQLTKP